MDHHYIEIGPNKNTHNNLKNCYFLDYFYKNTILCTELSLRMLSLHYNELRLLHKTNTYDPESLNDWKRDIISASLISSSVPPS